jgi:hypothetical protein
LAYQVGEGVAACFPMDILIAHLPKPAIDTDDNNLFDIELAVTTHVTEFIINFIKILIKS